MRLAYLGTPEIAVPPLRELVDAGHEIVLVITRPDARRSRRGAATPSPVKAAARELDLAVSDDLGSLRDVDVDLGVVVAYGRIIPVELLERVPMVNLHFSLLPRWRGAAPVERAVLAGDPVTGVTLMQLDEGLDTGPVHASVELSVGRATAAELREELSALGATLLVESLAAGLGTPQPQPQDGVTYAEKLTTQDLRLDWAASAAELERVVRVGGAWTLDADKRLKVLAAEVEGDDAAEVPEAPGLVGDGLIVGTGAGGLRLERVQPEGRAAMAARDWANGAHPVGRTLG